MQKAFTIYAWNEFGEGGIVVPTVGDQYMKLEEIKKYLEANKITIKIKIRQIT